MANMTSNNLVQGSTQPYPNGTINRIAAWILRHWLLMANVLIGIYVLTPFVAPLFMKAGWAGPARAIYTVYSTQCHQLPQRSYFLFGASLTYPLDRINAARGSTEVWTLREFIGNESMGYKVAWSDRMISLYTSVWIGGMLYALLRRWLRPLPLALTAVLLVPILLDGTTHFLADLQGIGQGFRDTNAWLRTLTNNALPTSFYAGDGWGSFNSLMRLWTGALAGLALAWVVFPRIDPLIHHDRP
ncbi:MAG: DUF2085 domain-containing protein [Chloroflexi bacterium]|nr:DUF2085 domain-containing protein [Chloroflexota bacterium]